MVAVFVFFVCAAEKVGEHYPKLREGWRKKSH